MEEKNKLKDILRHQYSCNVFDYTDTFNSDKGWFDYYRDELTVSDVIIFFLAEKLSLGQISEVRIINDLIQNGESKHPKVFYIYCGSDQTSTQINAIAIEELQGAQRLTKENILNISNSLFSYIIRITDGLPADYFLFTYEKKIIEKYYETDTAINKLEFQNNGLPDVWPKVWTNVGLIENRITNPILDKVGSIRHFEKDRVLASALTQFHGNHGDDASHTCDPINRCPLNMGLTFPEAGPRKEIYSPLIAESPTFRVGVIVAGGTAPGINAVINGIVQRHFDYFDGELKKIFPENQSPFFDKPLEELPYRIEVIGFHNGFSVLKNLCAPVAMNKFLENNVSLLYDTTRREVRDGGNGGRNIQFKLKVISKEVDRPGSILETCRDVSLIEHKDRIKYLFNILHNLEQFGISLLYIIGGDGSMRAAHALATISRNNNLGISVCGIPKTMDNDILWVWKTFGFHSTVYKATDFINAMTYELQSRPRVGIQQLFGSFSGFVVCHAVLGARSRICDLAIIPELSFTISGIISYINERHEQQTKEQRKLKSLIVLAETVFPDDMSKIELDKEPELTLDEISAVKKAIKAYDHGCSKKQMYFNEHHDSFIDMEEPKRGLLIEELIREAGRIEIQRVFIGKTHLVLSNAVLKVIARKLHEKCKGKPDVITSEPRYLIRDVPPNPIDIIFGNRLATLAVDNMMAGYTDFMISQWLTEFCLVPLNLVVLGTKKVPKNGVFWKSVIAKTGQPENLI